ncbi:MAG TPA: hypothetical protein VKV30_12555 [Candidatus Angelobacter sp.]|nr:hypothetical protein [Candidatus Angelobacter sp.]
MNSFPGSKATGMGVKAQLAPGGKLLQLRVKAPVKLVGPGGLVAPSADMV